MIYRFVVSLIFLISPEGQTLGEAAGKLQWLEIAWRN
jgi:hypothetical protein